MSGGASGSALELQGVWAGYGGAPVVRDVSLKVAPGEFLGLIGPNGAGKSTLFKIVMGLLKPEQGRVVVFGNEARPGSGSIGYMPQVELVDWDFPVTVGDVVLMGRYGTMRWLRRASARDREAVLAALAKVDMTHLRDRLVGELSGGQRRRVLLARALVSGPKLLLLDEPMAGLDAPAQHQILGVLHELSETGVAVVMSTHDLSCASTACDTVCCLRGEVVATGPPAEVLTEEILSDAFGQHLLMVHVNGQAYAYQHHVHPVFPEEEG